jgi:hypothetical protein
MTKIALITDSHFGAKNDDQNFANFINEFYEKQFFPYLLENNIKHVIHLGDIMDRRKFVSYLTAKQFRQIFVENLNKFNIKADLIIGNHDTFFKHTNSLNSMRELVGNKFDNIKYHDSVIELNDKIILIPWINDENKDYVFSTLNKTKCKLVFGHFEIQGFGMYKGIINNDGVSSDVFSNFDMVFSGHYHHKSTKGNISYLGAPYEITWSDYDDDRGFHVFDTDTYHLEFIKNKSKLFHKIFYNDSKLSFDKIQDMDFSSLKNKYVKVIVSEKQNPYVFDMFMNKLESFGLADIQVVDDHKHLDIVEEYDIIDESSDTLSIINGYIDNRKELNDVDRIKKIMSNLYRESISE